MSDDGITLSELEESLRTLAPEYYARQDAAYRFVNDFPNPWVLGSNQRAKLLEDYRRYVEPVFAETLGNGRYPLDWEWRKYLVKSDSSWTCQAWNRAPDCLGGPLRAKYLHVHHLEGKEDVSTDNPGGPHDLSKLLCVCERCHSKIHPHLRDQL